MSEQINSTCNLKFKKQIDKNELYYKPVLIKLQTPELQQVEYGFNKMLNDQRDRIDKINSDIWKKVRWYINDYDFLVKDSIINRAFFKYWEMIYEFTIFENFKSKTESESDVIFHCAEAPGGFIQGSNVFFGLKNEHIQQKLKMVIDEDGFVKKVGKEKKQYKIFTISLNKDISKYKMYNLPTYNKTIINKHVCITFGCDNTGDINNPDNIIYLKSLVSKSNRDGCYLVTADGGFDEGSDFNHKEQLHHNLILNEIYLALNIQKPGGTFILKMFDIFTKTSVHMLYLLNLMYDEIYIYKPKTSRPTNSEKYIICKGFNCEQKNLERILDKLKLISNQLRNNKSNYISFTLFDNIPEEFIQNIYNANNILVRKQCNHLNQAITLCDSDDFLKNYEIELQTSIKRRTNVYENWEKQYNLKSFIQ